MEQEKIIVNEMLSQAVMEQILRDAHFNGSDLYFS